MCLPYILRTRRSSGGKWNSCMENSNRWKEVVIKERNYHINEINHENEDIHLLRRAKELKHSEEF